MVGEEFMLVYFGVLSQNNQEKFDMIRIWAAFWGGIVSRARHSSLPEKEITTDTALF